MTPDPDAPEPERYWALRRRRRTTAGWFQRQREQLTHDPQARDWLVARWVREGSQVDVAEFVVLPAGRGRVRHVQVQLTTYQPKGK